MPWDILFFGLGVAAITFARRWRNSDSSAGVGVAGWGMAVFVLYMLNG
jgi:hypothetical protein